MNGVQAVDILAGLTRLLGPRADLLRRSLWLIPLFVALHNLEEYPAMVAYAHRHVGRTLLPLPTRRPFGVAVALVTALPVPLVAWATSTSGGSERLAIGVALHGALLANAAAHAAQTVWFRERSPGTVTALALFVPHAAYTVALAIRRRHMTPRQLLVALALGAVSMAPVALALQSVGFGVARDGPGHDDG